MLALLAILAASAAPNVVLISLDTTRADALSCYGEVPPGRDRTELVTPNLDALAAEGLRFTEAWTHAPTTLSAHASLFTGRDPHQHRVVRNGVPLSSTIPTLSERFEKDGWDTIGVVGASALEREMGLARGFRVYDDEMSTLSGLMYQRTAEEVTAAALARVDERAGGTPLFLFVHYYDPHTPYVPPDSFARSFTDEDYAGAYARGQRVGPLQRELEQGTAAQRDVAHVAGLYLAEVAYVDHAVGTLLVGLRERGLLDEALVVVTADHGEVLSEAPTFAYSHGTDVSKGAMRIPMIVRGYGVPLADPGPVSRTMALSHLGPTIERIVLGTSVLGQDRWDLVRPGPVRLEEGWPERPVFPVYLEATRPIRYEAATGWNNLSFFRGVRLGPYGLEAAPIFGVAPRPAEGSADTDPQIFEWMRVLLERWDAGAPAHVDAEMAPSTQRALEALGYVE